VSLRSQRRPWRSRGGGPSVKNAAAAAAFAAEHGADAPPAAVAFNDNAADPADNRAFVTGPL